MADGPMGHWYPGTVPVRQRNGHNQAVTRSQISIGRRVPWLSAMMFLLALLLVPGAVLGADWTSGNRVTSQRGSRLDSLHQLAAGNNSLHLSYARIGPNQIDDRVVYQRSSDRGASWTKERVLFASSGRHRQVVPNVALAAGGASVVVAWRVLGQDRATLFVRTSANGGLTFGEARAIASAKRSSGLGVPAVAIGNDVIAVAWTDRSSGKIERPHQPQWRAHLPPGRHPRAHPALHRLQGQGH